MDTIKLRMTDAQVGALQCAYLDDMPAVRGAWDGSNWLRFDRSQAEALWSEINDASNSEDGTAEELRSSAPECAKLAGRAARSLAALGGRILRLC